MPELPEVEMARDIAHRNLLNSQVRQVEVLDPRMLKDITPDALVRKLRNQDIVGTGRHGKNLFVCFNEGALYIHLGMSGSISFSEDTDWHSPHERLRIIADRGVMILDDPRRFGRFGLVRSMDHLIADNELGPDALTVPDKVFISRLEGRKGSIKPLLLDQRVVAGVGNLYADEALFQERLHPTTKIDSISRTELARLGKRIRTVLESSISVRTDFSRLPEGYLLRDRREGAPCPRCATELVAIRVGGRTTVLCPACQSHRTKR
ncbi:MAG: Fpg/Nei family DNA glycosylase [Methanomassiliicoccales archaeon]